MLSSLTGTTETVRERFLAEAFSEVTLLVLKIDRAGPGVEWVAKQVLAAAQLGERDPAQIREFVLSVRVRRPKWVERHQTPV